jgi:hypothetical protein
MRQQEALAAAAAEDELCKAWLLLGAGTAEGKNCQRGTRLTERSAPGS